jgi:hypothetical protein
MTQGQLRVAMTLCDKMALESWRDHISQYFILNFSGKRVMMNDLLAPIHKIPTHSTIISVAIMAGLQKVASANHMTYV